MRPAAGCSTRPRCSRFGPGDLDATERLAGDALALARRLGDARGLTGAGHLLAMAAGERGDTAAEADLIGQMLADADRSGDPRMQIQARSHVALGWLRRGEFDRAATSYDELLSLMGRVEVMRETIGATWFNRGLAELHGGRLAAAADCSPRAPRSQASWATRT